MTTEEQISDLRRDIERVHQAGSGLSGWEMLADIESTIRRINRKYDTNFTGYNDALSEAESYLWRKHDKLCGY